jgi:outer membrane beta-barrel protein
MPLTQSVPAVLGILAAVASTPAFGADTLDIGVLKNEDISVVQKVMYPKADRTELGIHLGVMPLDTYLLTPNAQLSLDHHFTDTVALSVLVGGGYGFETAVYHTLESPTFGVAPYAYRYLASALAGVQWAPIYAKLNWNGARVLHFDVYVAGRVGGSLEQSVLPDGGFGFGPTISPALGARAWLSDHTTLRVEARDDVLVERRSLTQTWNLKQNTDFLVGLTFFTPAPVQSR